MMEGGQSMSCAIEARNLTICDSAGRAVVDRLCLELAAGQTLVVVGESGAGKTTLSLALFGRLRHGLNLTEGMLRVCGSDVLGLRGRELRKFRRCNLSYLSQDPALSLTADMTVWQLLRELGCASREQAEELLSCVGLGSGCDGLLDRRPGSLSGGQRRRVALVRAMVAKPRLLVLDEPTSGVDPTAAREIVKTVESLCSQSGCAVLVITHDLAVARAFGARVAVMQAGRIVEQGGPEILDSPRTEPVRRLVACDRLEGLAEGVRPRGRVSVHGPAPVMAAEGLCVDTPDGRPAVRGLSFVLRPGECIGLRGSSGAGKSTVVAALTGLRPPACGTVSLAARTGRDDDSGDFPLVALPPSCAQRTADQLLSLQTVPQDPVTSLNPALSVGRQLDRAVRRCHPSWGHDKRLARVEELLRSVDLDGGIARRMPRELSGGQAQRVAIARALGHEPLVLICDECTSALDATTQEGVLRTLARLRDEAGMALIMVTHAVRVSETMCGRTYEVGNSQMAG